MEKYVRSLLRELAHRGAADVEAIKAELRRVGYDGPEVGGKPAPAASAANTAPKETVTE